MNSIPQERHLRVKKLMLALQCASNSLQKSIEEGNLVGFEAVNWLNQFHSLVDEEERKTSCQIAIVLGITEATKLFELIEQYENSPNPLQYSNFGSPIYYTHYLSKRIELLYKIGSLVKILAADETFDSSTYVNYKTQDVCNRVCQWVEEKLWLKLLPVNVYEPFIRDCQRSSLLREANLQRIGLRAGLLNEGLIDEDYELSADEAKLVVDWVQENCGVELPLPAAYLLKSEPTHNKTSKPNLFKSEPTHNKTSKPNLFKSYIAKLTFLILIFGSISTLFAWVSNKILEPQASEKQVSEDSRFLMEDSLQKLKTTEKNPKLKQSKLKERKCVNRCLKKVDMAE